MVTVETKTMSNTETFSSRLTSATTEIAYTLMMLDDAREVTITWTDADGLAQTVFGNVTHRGYLLACDVPDDDQAELVEAVSRLFDRAVHPA
jgi:hypothetical protein